MNNKPTKFAICKDCKHIRWSQAAMGYRYGRCKKTGFEKRDVVTGKYKRVGMVNCSEKNVNGLCMDFTPKQTLFQRIKNWKWQ